MNKNFTYQYLTIKNSTEIISELRKYYLDNSYTLQFNQIHGIQLTKLIAKCPSLAQWLFENKLQPTHTYYLVIKPHGNIPLHVDGQENDLSINFPIENCNDNWTTMYEVVYPSLSRYRTLDAGKVKQAVPVLEKTEICRCYATQPLILNTKIPHEVSNPTNSDRVTFLCRFKEDPWFLTENNS